jgi:hypothetical protein
MTRLFLINRPSALTDHVSDTTEDNGGATACRRRRRETSRPSDDPTSYRRLGVVYEYQSGFQIHVRSAFYIAPLMSLAPNSPLHFSRFLKNHFPVNLSRSKSQEVSNIFWLMFYDQKFLRKIWLFCWELFSRTDTISAVIMSTCQWSLGSLDPHFSCNLTSNQL